MSWLEKFFDMRLREQRGIVIKEDWKYCRECGLRDNVTSLIVCSSCKITQYCSRKCQNQDYKDEHKDLCTNLVKNKRQELAKIEKHLKANGLDIHDGQSFLEKHEAFSMELNEYAKIKEVICTALFEIAMRNESLNGIKLALDEMMTSLKMMPAVMQRIRYHVPLAMIMLGQDDQAFNFIKFWLARAKIRSDGLYGVADADLQGSEIMLKGHDLTEDIVEKLGIDLDEGPHESEAISFIYLGIIKINSLSRFRGNEAKMEEQMFLAVQMLEYLDRHFTRMPRHYLYNADQKRHEKMLDANGLLDIEMSRKRWLAYYIQKSPSVQHELADYFKNQPKIKELHANTKVTKVMKTMFAKGLTRETVTNEDISEIFESLPSIDMFEPKSSAVKNAEEMGLAKLAEGQILSPERKYCAECGATEQSLKAKKRSLRPCNDCKITLYCSRDCQTADFKDHNKYCGVIKDMKKVAIQHQKSLKSNGFDININYPNRAFFDEKFDQNRQIVHSYANTSQGILTTLFSLAVKSESHFGVKKTLDEMLSVLKKAQPLVQGIRTFIPMLMLFLGQDDEAYNFIKFWLKRVKGCLYAVNAPGDQQDPNVTMTGQDKTEDVLEVLEIDTKHLYYAETISYLYLAIIKINIMLKLKDEDKIKEQKQHFYRYLDYVEEHFPLLVKHHFTEEDFEEATEVDPDGIFTKDGLKKVASGRKAWFNFYFQRAPKVKKELDAYFAFKAENEE